jgi:hypothetical protein
MFPLFPLLFSKEKKGTTKSEEGVKGNSVIRIDKGNRGDRGKPLLVRLAELLTQPSICSGVNPVARPVRTIILTGNIAFEDAGYATNAMQCGRLLSISHWVPLARFIYSFSLAIVVYGPHRENVDNRLHILVGPWRCEAHLPNSPYLLHQSSVSCRRLSPQSVFA